MKSRPIRIIAWGNRGRRDDGVALVLAERLERRFATDRQVIVEQFHQLGPEVAEDVHDSCGTIFLDAHVREACADVSTEQLVPSERALLDTHHCPPDVLLTLGRSLGWNMPPAWLVLIRAHDMDFGDELSDHSRSALDRAESAVVALIDEARGGGCRHA